ncbi:hypothetical protein [Alteromonas gilva]|uniref:Uncharacterized protein n=1 Tax=Alteromonas gilva TaxID=2987522 RepID=A0ABT5L5C8_9ALTE|nr:hypothetical protein [Alteromonas gilva]MDC8832067.1 hypothetical protein [Alteromonas gilva]
MTNVKSTLTEIGFVLLSILLALSIGWFSKSLLLLWFGELVSIEPNNLIDVLQYAVIGLLVFLLIKLFKTNQLLLDKKRAFEEKQGKASGAILLYVSIALFVVASNWLSDASYEMLNEYLQVKVSGSTYWHWLGLALVLFVSGLIQSWQKAPRKKAFWKRPQPYCVAAVVPVLIGLLALIDMFVYSFSTNAQITAIYLLLAVFVGLHVFLLIKQHSTPRNLISNKNAIGDFKHMVLFISAPMPFKKSEKYDLAEDDKALKIICAALLKQSNIFADNKNKYKDTRKCIALRKGIVKKTVNNVPKVEEIAGVLAMVLALRLWLGDNDEVATPDEIDFDKVEKRLKSLTDSVNRENTKGHNNPILLCLFVELFEFIVRPACHNFTTSFSELVGIHDELNKKLETLDGTRSERSVWRMPLLALEQHLNKPECKLEACTLVFSKDREARNAHGNKKDGSHVWAPEFCALIQTFFSYMKLRDDRLEWFYYHSSEEQQPEEKNLQSFSFKDIRSIYNNNTNRGVAFHDLQDCRNVIVDIVKESEFDPKATVVDFTSGTKVTSIAAVLETTSSDIRSQYVDTNNYDIKLFDFRYYSLEDFFG